MIKIILKIDDASFRKHAQEQEETNLTTIEDYIREEIMEGLAAFCFDNLSDCLKQGIECQSPEFVIDIRDTYEDLPLPVGED